jgi:BirA family transcriptional regulator, biotin operon repressor / biotin---[acetyl-CoA-carboxylase] ligase
MLTEHTVAEVALAAGIEAPAHFFDVIGSTNDALLGMAEQGAPEWTMVVAGHQDSGRGRLGRSWSSLPGSSLLMSLLVRPSLAPADAALVTLGAGACMALSCGVASGIEVKCKWPNDLVVDNRKLGGVLVEAKVEGSRLVYAVIGIGLNVKQGASDFPPDLADSATSIAIEGGRLEMGELLYDFLVRVRRFCDPGDPRFASMVLDTYRGLCDTIGRRVRATTMSGQRVEGTAVGIGESGTLQVETASGVQEIGFGEVDYLR